MKNPRAPTPARIFTPHVPLLTELEKGIVGSRTYRHGAPNGACCFVIACLLGFLSSPVKTRAELLTNAAQVLSLSAERAAQKIPVRVKGVVTAAEPGWAGKFFIQDETKGVFIANRS